MSASEATHETSVTEATHSKRPWRVRWSLRTSIAVITLVCIASAWSTYRFRIGQTHDDVGRQLATIGEYAAWRPGVNVQWQYEQSVRTKIPVVFKGGVATISGATEITRQVKQTPTWMEQLGMNLMFQRIKSVRVNALLPPDKFDELVDQICRLDRVESLYFGSANTTQQLSHRDLERILSHTQVDELYAMHCPLDVGSIPALRQSQLKILQLSHTWFDDAAVRDLPNTLTSLSLERTHVTDAGLPEFERLHRLEYLNLKRTPTSEEAIENLRGAMPWCEVVWEPLKQP
ncbi:hypothetical protein C5Y96_07130 [Blastopirellula marina]|uniref:Leucine-rich repeat domain-containing protein n=1 Tax=Blastopirellula marina TaxID=124 RepID=A0A2S8FXN2_9BACT|nr:MULTISPECIES: hypothetical protein [Pirellulaceae]PQO36928.1 hypothetical protein C5Y96_07130 [Blastopirellula marina]RCS53643.1 hypothetical protein DTL36_07140 [Bremerella cremea]